jgi:hypothetical protein
MAKEFKRTIFDSEGYTFDEAKKFLIEDQGIENPTEDEIYEEIYECNYLALKDERFEFAQLDNKLKTRIVAIANVGRWNGRKAGLKNIGHLEEVIDFMRSYDSWELYIDRYQLKGVGHHHDGTDYLTFKEIKEKYDYETLEELLFCDDNAIDVIENKMTTSLRKYFKGYLY